MSGPTATIISAILAAAVALYIAFLHRRQMRQIEARRLDQTLPLKPPPSALWVWFTKYMFLIVGIMPAVNLISLLNESTPVTRRTIFDISLSVVLIAVAVLAFFQELTIRLLLQSAQLSVDGTVRMTGKIVEVVAELGRSHEALSERVDQIKPNAPPSGGG